VSKMAVVSYEYRTLAIEVCFFLNSAVARRVFVNVFIVSAKYTSHKITQHTKTFRQCRRLTDHRVNNAEEIFCHR
jgi:hypothetical protein